MSFGTKVFAICDWEEDFGVRLMEYLQLRKRISFEIHVFTEVETLCNFAEKRRIEILLISDRLMDDRVRGIKAEKTFILSEGYLQEQFDDYFYVYKYQPVNRMLQGILDEYGSKNVVSEEERIWRRKKKIIGVFSPGECKNTSFFTIATGRVLARKYRVLYVNLQGISGLEQLTDEDHAQNLGELVYTFRRSKDNVMPRLRSMVKSIGEVDYIPPVRMPEDLFSISPEELSEIIRLIMEKSDYEIILLEMNSLLPYTREMMDISDQLIMISEGDALSKAREKQFERYMYQQHLLREKMIPVMLTQTKILREGKGCFEEVMRSNIGKTAENIVTQILQE